MDEQPLILTFWTFAEEKLDARPFNAIPLGTVRSEPEDAHSRFRAAAEFRESEIAARANATAKAATSDALVIETSREDIFAKRAPSNATKPRYVVTESGTTILYDENNEVSAIYAKGVEVPSLEAM